MWFICIYIIIYIFWISFVRSPCELRSSTPGGKLAMLGHEIVDQLLEATEGSQVPNRDERGCVIYYPDAQWDGNIYHITDILLPWWAFGFQVVYSCQFVAFANIFHIYVYKLHISMWRAEKKYLVQSCWLWLIVDFLPNPVVLCATDIPWHIGSTYGIFTYICHKNQPNVGKYTSPMDPVGHRMGIFTQTFSFECSHFSPFM